MDAKREAPASRPPAKAAKASILSWFTLAELIVVITILAILATIGFLALSGYSQDAKDAAVKANVRSVMTAISSESAVTNNSPRYYVVHDAAAALTGAAVAYVDGSPVTLTGGDWNQAGTNYSAGNPDWAKLKLNPDKFKLSKALPDFFSEALAAYDPKSISVGAMDAALAPTTSGRNRSTSFFQVAGVAPTTGVVSVVGDFPVWFGGIPGLVGFPGSLTWSFVDGSASPGFAAYPGCDTPDIALANGQKWAACNVGASTAYAGQSVTLADATAAGGPTAAQKAYMGAYFQWGRNLDVSTGSTVAGPLTAAAAASETRFITNGTAPRDWLSVQDDNLWGGTGSTAAAGTFASLGSPAAMKGPCAAGYHVPTQKEWCDAIKAVSPDVTACDAAWYVEATANKFMNTLKLPLAGYRNTSTAAFANQGTYGYYWAASTTGTYGNYVNLSTTNGVIPANNSYRANGFSVRCLKN